jgi:branched-subunit amino acid transport protein AzlD
MKIDFAYSLSVIVVVAFVTGLTRAIPYLIFGRMKELPSIVQYLGTVLPVSIMIILVVYCLRNIELSSFPFGLPELLSVAAVIVFQIKTKNALLSIFIGTACYMTLIRTVFI